MPELNGRAKRKQGLHKVCPLIQINERYAKGKYAHIDLSNVGGVLSCRGF